MAKFFIHVCFCALMALSILGQDDEVCVIGDETFVPGENMGDAFSTRCGSTDEWPCFCNPILPQDAECPYCTFAAGDGTLHCAKDGQNITFRDGSISRACTCEIPDDPTESPIRNCDVVVPALGCSWFDLNGDPVFFENGESFGDLIDGVCGPASEWPSFCYVPPGSSGGDEFLIDYPYCIYTDTESGEVLCTKDGETTEYLDEDNTELSCTCAYSSTDGPDPTCERVPPSPTTPTNAPTPAAPVRPPSSGGLPRGFLAEGALSFIFVVTSLTCFAVLPSLI
jgi:hypothetical protein